MRNSLNWPAVFFFTTGAGAAAWSATMPLVDSYGEPTAGLMPVIYGAAIMALALAQIVKRKPDEETAEPIEKRRLSIYVASLAGFALLLKALGIYVLIAIFVPLILRLAEDRSWKSTIVITAAYLLFMYLVFQLALGVALPTGTMVPNLPYRG